MRRCWSISLVAWAFICAPAVYADTQLALDQYYEPWSGPNGLETLRHMASCVVDRHPAVAQDFVRMGGSELDLRAKIDDLIDAKCVKMYWFRNSKTTIVPATYLPLLAEALLKRSYSAGQIPSVDGVGPLEHPALPDVAIETVHRNYREVFIVDKAIVQLEQMGECVARREPARVFQLAQTSPGSPDENSALSALASAIATCSGDRRQYATPTFARRGAFVANLYRLADAARPVTLQEVTR